ADAVGIQHRAIWIGRARCRSAGRSLPHSPVLQNRQRGHQNHQGTRTNETLHRLQPIVLSATCSRIFIVISTSVLSQKPFGENRIRPHQLEGRLPRGKWYRIRLKTSCRSRYATLMFSSFRRLAVPFALPWFAAVAIAQSASPPEIDDGRQWLNPRSPASSPLAVASRATALNQNDAAEKLLRQIIRRASRSSEASEAHKLLSRIYIRTGRYKRATDNLD